MRWNPRTQLCPAPPSLPTAPRPKSKRSGFRSSWETKTVADTNLTLKHILKNKRKQDQHFYNISINIGTEQEQIQAQSFRPEGNPAPPNKLPQQSRILPSHLPNHPPLYHQPTTSHDHTLPHAQHNISASTTRSKNSLKNTAVLRKRKFVTWYRGVCRYSRWIQENLVLHLRCCRNHIGSVVVVIDW